MTTATPITNTPDRPPKSWVVGVLLVLAAGLIYWRVCQCEFLNYDDPDYVTGNAYVQKGLTWKGVAWAFGNLHGEATYWHPLTWMSHMLDCQMFGLRSGWHHAMNLGLHALNAVLLFLVLKRLTGAFWRSAVVAAFWLLHPLQVDTVAWITERKNLLAGFFWLAALGFYGRYVEKPGWKRYLPVWLMMAAGLMTKPVLVTLPCLLLLLDYWPLRRVASRQPCEIGPPKHVPVVPPQPWHLILLEKLPLFGLSILFSVLTLRAHAQLDSLMSGEQLPWAFRLENAVVSYVQYVLKAVWPAHLAVFYPHPLAYPGWQVWGGLLILILVTAGLLWRVKRMPYLAVGWAWFLGVMFPAIGLVQAGSQAMADRFAYLPLMGLFVMLVWGGGALLEQLRLRPAWPAWLALLLMAACAVTTSQQVRHWKNTRTLFEHAAAVTRDNFVAYAVLGSLAAEAGNLAEARAWFGQSLAIRPSYHEGYVAFGHVLAKQRQFTEAAWQYQQALRVNPRLPEAHNGLGTVLIALGKPDEGVAHLEEALRLNPNFALARQNLEQHRRNCEQKTATEAALRQKVREQPDSAAALLDLGNWLINQRKLVEALECFRQVLRRDTNSVAALNRTAWILATHEDAALRNGAEALILAQRACQLTRQQDALSLNTLAAAYAELGQFNDATTTARQALDLATQSGQKGVVSIVQNLLKLYQAGQPYREMSRP